MSHSTAAITESQTEACPQGSDLPTTPAQLLARFDDMGITYTLHHHRAVYTVAESEAVDADIPGTHCRNLLLRDNKKRNYLVCLQNSTMIDIKKLADVVGSGKLSFGSADRLWEYLGVRPGSVCPYSIVNDTKNEVNIFLDASMMQDEILNFHPLINTMTVSVAPADLLRFIESTGHEPHIVDLNPAAPDKE